MMKAASPFQGQHDDDMRQGRMLTVTISIVMDESAEQG